MAKSFSLSFTFFYDMMCTNIHEDLSQKLAMEIGGENRPEWIMERHWERFAEEININSAVLRKRLTDFCLKLITEIDGACASFIDRYQGSNLLYDMMATIKKRTNRTLNQFE